MVVGCSGQGRDAELDDAFFLSGLTSPEVRPMEDPNHFDFGPVVARQVQPLPHVYTIANRSDSPWRLVRAVNQKSCCGDVEFTPTVLQPGESAELLVTLRLGKTFGTVLHRATVETDDSRAPALEFITTAEVYPAVRFEELATEGGHRPTFPGDSARRVIRAVSYGTSEIGPLDLDDASIIATSPAAWLAPSRIQERAAGLLERSREIELTWMAEGEPGVRDEVLRLVAESGEPIAQHPLTWEVAAAIQATPASLLFTSGSTKSMKLMLRSQDGQGFRITGIDSGPLDLSTAIASPETALLHLVTMSPNATTGPEAQAGRVTIQTDHPAEPTVTLPVFIPAGAITSSTNAGGQP